METIDDLIQLSMSSNNVDTKMTEITSLVQEKRFSSFTDFDGRTPLHFLATRDNIVAIKYLLGRLPGLDINSKDDMGWTALSNACYLGTLPMIIDLLTLGANPKITHFGGKTLLHLVAGNSKMSAEDKELAIFVLKAKTVNPRIRDIRRQTYEQVLAFDQAKDLIKTGVDPFGRTILHWAAYAFEAYKSQYEARVDLIQNVDDVGRTPLMYAVGIPKPNLPYIQWLINQGCSVSHTEKGGKTALHFAARWGNQEVIQCLLASGADPLLSDHMGQTAIDIASRYSPQILNVLEDIEAINTYAA